MWCFAASFYPRSYPYNEAEQLQKQKRPEFVACLAELDVHKFDDFADITCFVYLNDVTSGGRTRWRWKHRWPEFYDKPGPLTAQPDNACHDEVGTHIAPEAGLAVVHFPATTAETGGYADVNACHEAEEAADTKFICQEFIWTHPLKYCGKAKSPTSEKPDLDLTF